jgi:micrococcal nuclease
MLKILSWGLLLGALFSLTACEEVLEQAAGTPVPGQQGQVVRVIDGDTIDVRINGVDQRVRYVGVNTPESDEPCYEEALQANLALVQGQTVTLVKDQSDTDRFGRLLRYVYVGGVFVNERLVTEGFAEAVLYNPDREYYEDFRRLEQNAARDGLGCHASGIFDDGSDTR